MMLKKENRKSIKAQAKISAGIFIALILFIAFVGIVSGSVIKSLNADQSKASSFSNTILMPLSVAALKMQVDVIEVQQWLTDISATRGLNGLNDGFDEAAKSAANFGKHLDRATILSKEAELTHLNDILNKAKIDFPPYYKMGLTMAEGYIEGGPEIGNKIMGDFDGAAKKIYEDIDLILADIEKITELSTQKTLSLSNDTNLVILGSLISTIVVAIIATLIAIFQAKNNIAIAIADVISTLSRSFQLASRGDLNQRVVGIQRKDEAGKMVLRFNRMMDLFEGYAKEASAAINYASERKYYRKIVLTGMRGEFIGYAKRMNEIIQGMEKNRKETQEFARNQVSPAIDYLTQSSKNLLIQSSELSSLSEATIARSGVVHSDSEQASLNVQTVASASEELSASISEIKRQTEATSKIANEATKRIKETNETVHSLGDAAQKIGEIVTLIDDIADQTNMLALNATIEAARAGEAGKGFAVVAGEVKSLANQTAKATQEISQQVSSMQSVTLAAVDAIDAIATVISQMNENVENVTHAVDEQNAATVEISENVQQASSLTQHVSEQMHGVSGDAQNTAGISNSVFQAAQQLQEKSEGLKTAMDKFIIELG